MERGCVYLVGAGPGDPDLITVRAAEVLSRADVVVYDRLIPKSVLGRASEDAELIYAGKSAGSHRMRQEEINALLVDRARAGRTVVRLKGGDPFVFGRGGEEALVLAEAGVNFEVVPGITAAVGASAYAGIPLTHRDFAATAAFVTGHRARDRDHELDWHTLARWDGTLVFYMGVSNLPRICEKLVEGGRDADTPAAMVQTGCTPEQRVVSAPLRDLPARAREGGVEPPALLIVGSVTMLRDGLQWFEHRPLFGLRVVVTRPAHQVEQTAKLLREMGARPVSMPTLRIVPPADPGPLERAVGRIESFDWVVFTSVNGVDSFFETLASRAKDARALAGCRLGVIGSSTRERLREFGLRADLVPKQYTTEGLVEAFGRKDVAEGRRILCPRSGIAPPDLIEGLTALGAEVSEVEAYTVVRDNSNAGEVQEQLGAGGIDWITFTSSSSVESFFSAVEPELVRRSSARIATIGPRTTATLDGFGFTPDAEASPHTVPAMLQAMTAACRGAQRRPGGSPDGIVNKDQRGSADENREQR